MLTLADVRRVCTVQRGIDLADITFHTVFTNEETKVSKGLFVPLYSDKNDSVLKEAINNGAIAAIWGIDQEIPRFVPTHFPIFIVDHPIESFKQVLQSYLHQNETSTSETKFIISLSNKHIQQNDSYANAVKEEYQNLKNFVHNLLPNEPRIKEGGKKEC